MRLTDETLAMLATRADYTADQRRTMVSVLAEELTAMTVELRDRRSLDKQHMLTLNELCDRRGADLSSEDVEALHMVRGMVMYDALPGVTQRRMLDVVDKLLATHAERSK